MLGDLDVEGAKVVKERDPESFLIFLYPDNMEDLGVRLRARPIREAEEKIIGRLKIAEEEMLHQNDFDVKIENTEGKFEETVEKVLVELKKLGITPQK